MLDANVKADEDVMMVQQGIKAVEVEAIVVVSPVDEEETHDRLFKIRLKTVIFMVL
jgi:hypothetical protein